MLPSSFKPVKKAIFPVGGLGTRFLPATKALPKEMLPIHSKPLIQYAYEEARAAGIEQCIFVTGRNKNAISNHFDHSYELQSVLTDHQKENELHLTKGWMPHPGQIAFVRQQYPLGLGHAIWCARHFIQDEPVAIILADELFLSKQPGLTQMMQCYNETGANIVGISEVEPEFTHRYGIVDTKGNKEKIAPIYNMVEKPKKGESPSNSSIVGRYILLPSIFQHLEKNYQNHDMNDKKEMQLTDAMVAQLQDSPYYGVKLEGKRFDCGNPMGFLEANIAFSLEDPSSSAFTKDLIQQYYNAINN